MIPLTNYDARTVETLALGDLLESYGGPKIALRVLKQGGAAPEFMRAMSERIKESPLTSGADALLGLDSHDTGGYSICRAIRSMMDKNYNAAGLERSISDLVVTKTGIARGGMTIPLALMARDFNVGTAAEAGNLVATAVAGQRANDPLRKVSVLAGLGATIVSGLHETVHIPRFNSSSAAAWKSEIAAAATVLETTAYVDLTPKRCAVQMTLSRQALMQATPELDVAIGRQLTAALLELIETDALNGDGTNDTPVGVRSTAGITTVVGGTDGLQLTFDHLADLEKGPDAGNCAVTANAGYVVNAATRRWLRSKQRAAGLGFVWDGGERPLLGYRAGVSNILPSNLSKGASGAVCSSLLYSSDWSQLVIGIYGGGVDLTVDHITAASTGLVKITAALYVGVGVVLPSAFSKMDDAKTA